MNKDRIAGSAKEIKGSIKETIGKAIGDAKLEADYRSSKVVGGSVVNDANETIGTIDDLLVSRDGKQPYAVLSIGGFLGMGTRLVVVPYEMLRFGDKRVTLPGGTKKALKMLP